jgi:hypothetical protein
MRGVYKHLGSAAEARSISLRTISPIGPAFEKLVEATAVFTVGILPAPLSNGLSRSFSLVLTRYIYARLMVEMREGCFCRCCKAGWCYCLDVSSAYRPSGHCEVSSWGEGCFCRCCTRRWLGLWPNRMPHTSNLVGELSI